MNLEPAFSELTDAVRSAPRWNVAGAGTKRPIAGDGVVPTLSTRKLRGIVEYSPDEYVISALAGTPVRELVGALAENGQFLPFDPLLVEAGATLGGVVATGTNGPGRLRYGGVRDFILGVRFVDGEGRLLRTGSKVVKNAAGFDLPKFFVGAGAGYGLLAEITLKVFPRPQTEVTVGIPVATNAEAAAIMTAAGRSRWQPYAVDLPPAGGEVIIRLGGPLSALDPLARDVLAQWPGRLLRPEESARAWEGLRELHWAHPGGIRCKVSMPASRWPELRERVVGAGGSVHVTVAGDAAYVSWPAGTEAATVASSLQAPGVAWTRFDGRGSSERTDTQAQRAVKSALDPSARFGSASTVVPSHTP